MSARLTIRADGIEWPLQTFLDARGFIRLGDHAADRRALLDFGDAVVDGEWRHVLYRPQRVEKAA